MLLRKDLDSDTNQKQGNSLNNSTRKGPGAKKASTNHLATDNVMHHTCKLRYPSIGGTPRNGGGLQKPV